MTENNDDELGIVQIQKRANRTGAQAHGLGME
jgi:hypothetical protein